EPTSTCTCAARSPERHRVDQIILRVTDRSGSWVSHHRLLSGAIPSPCSHRYDSQAAFRFLCASVPVPVDAEPDGLRSEADCLLLVTKANSPVCASQRKEARGVPLASHPSTRHQSRCLPSGIGVWMVSVARCRPSVDPRMVWQSGAVRSRICCLVQCPKG